MQIRLRALLACLLLAVPGLSAAPADIVFLAGGLAFFVAAAG